MPIHSSAHLPKPKSWDEFEDILCDTMKIRWNDQDVTRHGRTGQAQQGVDIYSNALSYGAQGKNTVKGITQSVIESEIAKAEEFTLKLKKLYIGTTADTDNNIQKFVWQLSQERTCNNLFSIEIMFWNDIQQEMTKDEKIIKKYYPQFFNSFNEITSTDVTSKKLSTIRLAYKGTRISEYIELIFGWLGRICGEDQGQFRQLCIEIKAYAKQIFNKSEYNILAGDIDKIENLAFEKCIDEEANDERWANVFSLAKIIEKRIKTLDTILSHDLLSLFTLGEILSFLDSATSFDTFEEYQATVIKYTDKIIDCFKVLGVQKNIIDDVENKLKYASYDDSIATHNVPHQLYVIAVEVIKMNIS